MKKSFALIQWSSILTLLVLISSCDKETDDTQYDKPADYYPLQIGKYILYRLDSTRFINFGQDEDIVSYQAKDVVEGTTTDLLGRPAWRIQRYLRPLNSTNDRDWKESVAYEVTPGENTLELYENNLRFIKMQGPIKEGRNWAGNGYLPDQPYSQYEFSAAVSIQFWDYTIEETGISTELNGKNYDNTITITQINDSSNVPVVEPNRVGQKTVWVEKYAKDIGLIYKDAVIWEYQPPATDPQGKKIGFGIRLSILDHN